MASHPWKMLGLMRELQIETAQNASRTKRGNSIVTISAQKGISLILAFGLLASSYCTFCSTFAVDIFLAFVFGAMW